MNKFKIDNKKKVDPKKSISSALKINIDLYRWVKCMAGANDVTVPCAMEQMIEFARNNSEKIVL